MKGQRKIPIKKAGASTPAQTNEPHRKPYLKAVPVSSLKEKIGELLLSLLAGHGQPDGWRQFDRLLRQFYEGGVL